MKIVSATIATAISLLSCGIDKESKLNLERSREMNKEISDFYSLSAETINGEWFNFSELKGKRVLIVNTASKCGYTKQYEDLQALYDKYGGEDFEIIAFPSNDFGAQEPGSNEEIMEFCKKNYGVSFRVMAKAPVTGKNKQAVYQWLTEKEYNGVQDSKVSWNFNKFLVDEHGTWVAHYASKVKPMGEELTAFAEGK